METRVAQELLPQMWLLWVDGLSVDEISTLFHLDKFVVRSACHITTCDSQSIPKPTDTDLSATFARQLERHF